LIQVVLQSPQVYNIVYGRHALAFAAS